MNAHGVMVKPDTISSVNFSCIQEGFVKLTEWKQTGEFGNQRMIFQHRINLFINLINEAQMRHKQSASATGLQDVFFSCWWKTQQRI